MIPVVSRGATLREPAQGEWADAAAVARYADAVARVDGLIEAPQTPVGKSLAQIRARAEMRLARMRQFLAFLGDPFTRYPIVHVGGTSGKGSTATAIASILHAAGYKVGMHTSPYLQVATEKLWTGGELIGPGEFADRVDEVFVEYNAWLRAGGEALTYGEFWVALVARHLAHEAVDIAVIEVGAGGRFDLTNVVSPIVSVVTSIGLDHTVTLGPTLGEIAWHKAGIIKPGAAAITGAVGAESLRPIETAAAEAGTSLDQIELGRDIEVLETGPGGTRWREIETGRVWPAAPGGFQAMNAALAVATARRLRERGFAIPGDAITTGLERARLPGRVEVMPGDVMAGVAPRVMLDGAHNPQKIAALISDLDAILPRNPGARRIGVLGVLEAKDFSGLVGPLVPAIDELVATSPQVLSKAPLDVEKLAAAARTAGFHGPVTLEPDPGAAIDVACSRATGPDDAVLVTGSLYLVGNVRGRWYPDEDILRARTSWPARAVDSPAGSGAP